MRRSRPFRRTKRIRSMISRTGRDCATYCWKRCGSIRRFPHHPRRDLTRRHRWPENRRWRASVDQRMGHASPPQILGASNRVHSSPFHGQDRALDANARVHPLRWRASNLGRFCLCPRRSANRARDPSRALHHRPWSGRPVLPLGRTTTEPSYEPLFRIEPAQR